MSEKKFYQFESIFEVLQNQHLYLKNKNQDVITVLNQIAADLDRLKEKHSISCLLFHNRGEHNEFYIFFQAIDENKKFHAYYDYEMHLNDGTSFGLGNYKDEIDEFPIPDYFDCERSKYLNEMMFQFFVECYWNSHLFAKDIPCIYSHTTDCDSLVELKDPYKEYHSIESILERHV